MVAALSPGPATAWGNEGHEIIALIAAHYLEAATRAKVAAMLAADPDNLTAHDIASEATWADKYRDSDRNGARNRYEKTRQWHFVDIELTRPSLDDACFGRPPLPTRVLAANGPARTCVVDKIEQFAHELADPAIDQQERLVALKFLLHLVGDVHQPLHAADDQDAGGNRKGVFAEGLDADNLHRLWDVELVEQLGTDPQRVASDLIANIPAEQARAWSQGTAVDWAMESFAVARDRAYGLLPPAGAAGAYTLSQSYIGAATRDVALQLSKAGVRLAFVLHNFLGREQ